MRRLQIMASIFAVCLMLAFFLVEHASAASFQGLGSLPTPWTPESYAHDVSGDGSSVVGESVGEAFRWTSNTGLVGLGTLPGDRYSWAYGVSGNGSVVVGDSGFITGAEAFRWTQESGMVGLGFLPEQNRSEGHGVSADGAVIVGSSRQVSLTGIMEPPMIGVMEPAVRGQKTGLSKWPI